MREKHTFAVLSFASTAAAIETESWCRENGVPGRLIPLPEEISAGCGLAWRMEPAEWETYRENMENAGIPFEKMTPVRQWTVRREAGKQSR